MRVLKNIFMRLLASIILLASGGLCMNFNNHGYEDLLVTISPDLPQTNAKIITESIKDWIRKGSETLYSSSRHWAYIRHVKILIPSTWTDIAATAVDGVVYEDGDVRVGLKNSVYGISPFTVQTGGCGEPGDHVQVSDQFFTRYTNMNDTFGPLGQVFVHEFAKYRYGVFEEYGYPGDLKYPMFYYKASWTADGQVNKLSPTFCINDEILDYKMQDITTGVDCKYDVHSGLPNSNCIAVIGRNNNISSSIMAIPYLRGNDQFCDDQELYVHRPEIPTKHNDICKGRSTFEVVKDHADFRSYKPGTAIKERTTSFEIIRPAQSSSFVMVLDVSGSMDDNCKGKPPGCEYRIDRMKQSAIRWVQYDIKNGVPLGLVKFSTSPNQLMPLTPVDDNNKNTFINKLKGLRANGGTCLGSALRGGLSTLRNGGVPHGGVLIFLTDGAQSCNGPDVNAVISEVVKQGVRVITIAFSDAADKDIIKLAQETNGKAYFVPDDSGPEVINNAMQGSLTYQPSVPSIDADVVIYEKTFKDQSSIHTSFLLDQMLGKNVTVQIDFSGNPGVIVKIHIEQTQFDVNGVLESNFKELNAGRYNISISSIKPQQKIGYASIRVTAKARSSNIPIMTRCWTSVGNNQADMSKPGTKIAVLAEVFQGENPVIGAKVKAYIERDNVPQPLEITLLDSGSSPDKIANDGIYARYFSSFDPNKGNTRYTLKCQVEGTEGSKINQGFIDAKSLPIRPNSGTPVCCGSNTIREGSKLTSTGMFSRSSTGGLIEITNADKVAYAPEEISNLRGSDIENLNSFSLSFTSTGLVLDSGTAKNMTIYYSQNKTALIDTTHVAAGLPYLSASDVLNPPALVPQEAGTEIEVNVKRDKFSLKKQYYFRIVTVGTKKSSWSNIAPFYLAEKKVEPGSARVEVVAVSAMIFSAIVTLYF